MEAFRLAKEAMLRALDTPIAGDGIVRSSGEDKSESAPAVGAGRGGIGLVRVHTMGGRRRSEGGVRSKL